MISAKLQNEIKKAAHKRERTLNQNYDRNQKEITKTFKKAGRFNAAAILNRFAEACKNTQQPVDLDFELGTYAEFLSAAPKNISGLTAEQVKANPTFQDVCNTLESHGIKCTEIKTADKISRQVECWDDSTPATVTLTLAMN